MLNRWNSVLAIAATAVLAVAPFAPAAAEPHGFGIHPWCLGRGVVGAVAAIVTLPLAIAAAALSIEPPEPYGPPAGYYPQQGYYPQPSYYARPAAYYRAPAYYGAPRAYYSPVDGYGRAPGYAPRAYYDQRAGYHGGYGGNVPSHSGRPDYRR